MTTWRRLIGYKDDAAAGGTPYDDLVAGAVPDADAFVPVTTANVTGDPTQLDRNNEVRGFRGNVPPVEFQARADVEFTANAYPSLVKKLVRLWTGGTDTMTGAAPAAITHQLKAIQSGDLPAIHMGVVRDEQYDKVAGLTCNQLTLDFPLAEWATVEAQLRGKYRARVATAPPAADYTGYPRRGYLLRDAQVLLAGSLTPVPNLRGVRLVLDNRMVDPEFWPMRNRVVTAYGTPSVDRTVWWPHRNKFMSHMITGQIIFGAPSPDEDLKRELAHAEKFVLECEFEALGTTPAATEMLRITGQQMVRTGGGPEALVDEDEITSTYEFGLYVGAAGEDTMFEFVDDSSTAIT